MVAVVKKVSDRGNFRGASGPFSLPWQLNDIIIFLTMAPKQNKPDLAKGSKTSSRKRAATKKSAGPASSLSGLQQLAKAKIKQHFHSEATTENYDGYIKRGKAWLASFFQEEHEAEARWKAGSGQGLLGEGEEDINRSESMLEDPEFRNAFDGHPVKSTAQAIAMFLAWKCFSQLNGKSTADGIHASFITYYDQM